MCTRISVDGRGRWMDNVFIERQWRSLKYECVFLNAFEMGSEISSSGIGFWIDYYRTKRPHSALGYRPPPPETIVQMDRTPVMHQQSNRTGQVG